jgi:hypothetical protein
MIMTRIPVVVACCALLACGSAVDDLSASTSQEQPAALLAPSAKKPPKECTVGWVKQSPAVCDPHATVATCPHHVCNITECAAGWKPSADATACVAKTYQWQHYHGDVFAYGYDMTSGPFECNATNLGKCIDVWGNRWDITPTNPMTTTVLGWVTAVCDYTGWYNPETGAYLGQTNCVEHVANYPVWKCVYE